MNLVTRIKKLLGYSDAAGLQSQQVEALFAQVRAEQIRDNAIVGRHMSTDSLGTVRKNIVSEGSVGIHINGYKNLSQSIAAGVWTKISWGDIREDKLLNWDATRNGFAIPYGGIYLFSCAVRWEPQSNAVQNVLKLYINGTAVSTLFDGTVSSQGNSTKWSTMSVGADFGRVKAGDFIEFYVYSSESSSIKTLSGDTRFNAMQLV